MHRHWITTELVVLKLLVLKYAIIVIKWRMIHYTYDLDCFPFIKFKWRMHLSNNRCHLRLFDIPVVTHTHTHTHTFCKCWFRIFTFQNGHGYGQFIREEVIKLYLSEKKTLLSFSRIKNQFFFRQNANFYPSYLVRL